MSRVYITWGEQVSPESNTIFDDLWQLEPQKLKQIQAMLSKKYPANHLKSYTVIHQFNWNLDMKIPLQQSFPLRVLEKISIPRRMLHQHPLFVRYRCQIQDKSCYLSPCPPWYLFMYGIFWVPCLSSWWFQPIWQISVKFHHFPRWGWT